MAVGSDVNQVFTILERRAAMTIVWASTPGLQFHTTKTEAALFTIRRAHEKHLGATMTTMIWVKEGFRPFNRQATGWLGVWMGAHLTLKEHHNQCMKKARAAKARLQTLTHTYRVEPESVRAYQVPCVQVFALNGSELWWDPKEVGRQDNLRLVLNQQARYILGVLPTTSQGV